MGSAKGYSVCADLCAELVVSVVFFLNGRRERSFRNADKGLLLLPESTLIDRKISFNPRYAMKGSKFSTYLCYLCA